MADDDLQSIVDELTERLEQSVAIDDPAVRLLAASRHFGDDDPVRVSSVLNRAIPAEISDPHRVRCCRAGSGSAPRTRATPAAAPRGSSSTTSPERTILVHRGR